MKTLVISAVNITEGGPLTVLRDCVGAAAEVLPDWRIIVMAHDSSLIDSPHVEVRTFPSAKASWCRRLALEWWGFKAVSRDLGVDLWLSLQDVTPRVTARRQATYCQNPAPFSRATLADSWFEPKYLAFCLFYGWLYAVNIERNYAVVVQQERLRREFRRRFGAQNVIVAYPSVSAGRSVHHRPQPSGSPIFFYPAVARCFKNFELIGAAIEILEGSAEWNGCVRWTIDGTENRYSRWLHRRFANLRTIHWIGYRPAAQINEEYARASCLLFPSRVETWGLPISEAKAVSLPMIVAERPYALETVGTYDRVCFVQPDDPKLLAELMLRFQRGTLEFRPASTPRPSAPFVASWNDLISLLTQGL